ncbi:MAG TPA: hypothetical protein PK887_07655 [Ignavibacteriales bacterium]|jgi:hypothetical protein|nr:hypothetical protein [Ignavibacteriales bacterium]
MFYLSLLISISCGLLVTFVTIKLFKNTIKNLLSKVIDVDIYDDWAKYINYVMYIIGLSSSFKSNELIKYSDNYYQYNLIQFEKLLVIGIGTIINVLQSLAWILFIFYIAILIILVIIKILNNKQKNI